jgi:hypothetical protein
VTYNKNGVSVDQHFVRSGGKSYAINKINSVEVRKKVEEGSKGWLIAWICAGLLALVGLNMATGGANGTPALIIAVVLGVVGYSSFKKRHPTTTYELYLMTSSSEVQAFTTDDSLTMRELRNAIERAMIGGASSYE